MDTYKTILNTIVEPLCEFNVRRLRIAAECIESNARIDLEEAADMRRAIHEMVERACRYIEMSVFIVESTALRTTIPDHPLPHLHPLDLQKMRDQVVHYSQRGTKSERRLAKSLAGALAWIEAESAR